MEGKEKNFRSKNGRGEKPDRSIWIENQSCPSLKRVFKLDFEKWKRLLTHFQALQKMCKHPRKIRRAECPLFKILLFDNKEG